MKNIIEEHFNQSSLTINSLKKHKKKILKIVNLIVNCKKKKKKILVAGNGGSCADAEHFTGELICTFSEKIGVQFRQYHYQIIHQLLRHGQMILVLTLFIKDK